MWGGKQVAFGVVAAEVPLSPAGSSWGNLPPQTAWLLIDHRVSCARP